MIRRLNGAAALANVYRQVQPVRRPAPGSLECIQNKRPVHVRVCVAMQMRALKFNYGALRN